MPLILGVQRGSRIYIDDEPLDVIETHGYKSIVVKVQGKTFTLTATEATEVLPSVRVSVGMPKGPKTHVYSRIVFDAPTEIPILRSEIYEGRGSE